MSPKPFLETTQEYYLSHLEVELLEPLAVIIYRASYSEDQLVLFSAPGKALNLRVGGVWDWENLGRPCGSFVARSRG